MTTPTSDLAVPFPSVQEPSESDGQSPQNDSAIDSQASKMTSSDKLTALPSHRPPPIDTSHRLRTPSRASHFGITAAQRGYRRSLDASTSLPSLSNRDFGLHAPVDQDYESWRRRSPARSFFRHHSPSGHSSPGRETPKARVSSESEPSHRHGHNVVQATIARLSGSRGTSEPSSMAASPPKRLSPLPVPHKHPESEPSAGYPHHRTDVPPTPPRMRSRAVSPLRIFQQWSNHGHSRSHRREEPFVPINPFKRKGQFKARRPGMGSRPGTNSTLDHESLGGSSGPYECQDVLPTSTIQELSEDVLFFVTDTFPRQLYLNFLLRLPAMYFTRVSRIFEDAEVSKPDIERMIEASFSDRERRDEEEGGRVHHDHDHEHERHQRQRSGLGVFSSPTRNGEEASLPRQSISRGLPFPDEWTPTSVPPSLFRFKQSWEAFIDSLLREWKTFNIVSALLASAIVSMFQVPEAVEDPITRTAALLSLICALMSLSYGCMYIVRFGTMRSMTRASNWAEEAQKTKTLIWWNVWVMLAMPAVWMAWAMLLFITAIMSFVWRVGSDADPPPGERPPIPFNTALGPRIAITFVFVLGMVYLFLIISTLKRYGASRGKATEAILRAGVDDVRISVVGDVGESLAAVAVPLALKPKGDSRNHFSGGTERRGRERHRSPLVEESNSALGLVDMKPLALSKVESTSSF
ncbi:hypothetical protein CC2G_011027 [Coprinopsis cinerea AmutBmut pab1-1]|nr:hypothetical protein CC2G_011027 [Coprinopsis cinerea AmutBmut pab1-1]